MRDGLQWQGRLGSVMSIFPPWGERARSMQRWKADDRYSEAIAMNAMRVCQYTEDKQGMCINNAGSITIPSVLPIQLLCGQTKLITGEGRGLVPVSYTHLTLPTILRV